MWLIQLYKSKENAAIEGDIYITDRCDTEHLADYIVPADYEHEISLCNDWHNNEKKRLLILNKSRTPALEQPQNQRMSVYYFEYTLNWGGESLGWDKNILVFEYLTELESLVEFYNKLDIIAEFQVSDSLSSSIDLINYIMNKSLDIIVVNESVPKYSIQFDNNCQYYVLDLPQYDIVIVVKKPFAFLMLYYDDYIRIEAYALPKLIQDFNDYTSPQSNYNIDTDQMINIESVIDEYFDSSNMSGRGYDEDISIDDESKTFGFNLIQSLLSRGDPNAASQYYFKLADNIGHAYRPSTAPYFPMENLPIYIYFPFFRPKLTSDNYFSPYPQYDPARSESNIEHFSVSLGLSANMVSHFEVLVRYQYPPLGERACHISDYTADGNIPSWRSADCDAAIPFRFAGATDCNSTDAWDNDEIKNNANYLFKVVKSESSNTYKIIGIGCNEITNPQPITFNTPFFNSLNFMPFPGPQSVAFKDAGWPILAIEDAISAYDVKPNETVFVLYNEQLVANSNEFSSIYYAVSNVKPNTIVCYIGSDEKIPDGYKNKVIHSDAIVTDLDTNEQMPLVSKYIRYAKRMYKMFNG